jgi:hypothetical protein
MDNVSTDQLKLVIESQHGGESTFSHSVRLYRANNPAIWDGVVHVFNLNGNQQAQRVYAWAAPVDGSPHPRFFAVLHQGRINSPVSAVSAAAAAIRATAPAA